MMVNAKWLSALEYDSLSISEKELDGAVSCREADRLSYYGERRPGFCLRTQDTVRLANYAGLVNLGGRVLEVLPKVERVELSADECRGVFLRLLRLARKIPICDFDGALQGLRSRVPLIEVFIAVFLDDVSRLVRGGLFWEYRVEEDDLTVIRGRLDIRRQIVIHGMRPDRLACRFDEMSPDNDWNRILKTALRCVRPWISNFTLRKKWAELWRSFEAISCYEAPEEVFSRLVPSRQVSHYDRAILWARWIISSLSPSLRFGEFVAPSLLFDTNLLFQEAVANHLKSEAEKSIKKYDVKVQFGSRYLASIVGSGEPAVHLRPDIVVKRNSAPILVADTKWKRLSMRGGYLSPDSGDVYQMLAYAAAFRCRDIFLIYPWHEGLSEAKSTVYEFAEVNNVRSRVHIVCVNVFSDSLVAVAGVEHKIMDMIEEL